MQLHSESDQLGGSFFSQINGLPCLTRWCRERGGDRNAQPGVGWGGMGQGKQDCPFWQPGRLGLAQATRENLLLILPFGKDE